MNSAVIKIKNNINGNELLKLLIDKIKIISFRELLQSMNDVFIKVVEKEGY